LGGESGATRAEPIGDCRVSFFLSSNHHHLGDSGTSNALLGSLVTPSVEMAPTRFPTEIWGRVFEHYFQPMRATGGMKQTVRAIELGKVCTAWKVGFVVLISTMFCTEPSSQAISEPYVYRDLNLFEVRVSGLERATYALSLPARSDKIFMWTRTFSLYLAYVVDDRLEAFC
jgi:hypothetical protein